MVIKLSPSYWYSCTGEHGWSQEATPLPRTELNTPSLEKQPDSYGTLILLLV